ncbi:putative sulfate/molybdate transporter [Rhodovibrio salinarum]|nr:putative sulfate/molybdate transporter [Rhodovibrio salinarum]
MPQDREDAHWSRELSGAFGDLGTFLPHVVAALSVVGMAPFGVLAGFGLFYIATGLIYALPVAVQPMKAASAAILVSDMSPGSVAACGLIVGLVFLALGVTGAIGRLARIVPDAVVSGLQLGLGLTLALLGLRMMLTDWVIAVVAAGLLVALLWVPRCPAALVALAGATGVAVVRDGVPAVSLDPGLPNLALIVPSWTDLWRGFELAALPQIPLTLTNAIIVTATLSGTLFAKRAHRVTPRNLALTTGAANLLLAPLGAYPMCHGAGGMAAHHRFGARGRGAPLIMGSCCLILAGLVGGEAPALLALVPEAAVGCLLVATGWELASALRARAQPLVNWPILAATAAATLAVNAFAGFVLGCLLAWLWPWVRGRLSGRPSGTHSGAAQRYETTDAFKTS